MTPHFFYFHITPHFNKYLICSTLQTFLLQTRGLRVAAAGKLLPKRNIAKYVRPNRS